jgi:DNA-binding NarL/FixJ family response regulator
VVGEASTAGEALRRIQAERPDVAVLDCRCRTAAASTCAGTFARRIADPVSVLTSYDDKMRYLRQ